MIENTYIDSRKAKELVYNDYKRNAERKNRSFEISFEQFLEITSKPCYLSNIPARFNSIKHGKYIAHINGIDRIDSNGNYTIDNIKPCNSLVNRMKNDLSYSDFMFMVESVYNNKILGGK